ncbi:MAG: hypothetical protein GX248_11180 [Peptococcaceae bacterium]|nr:hypothetical protein [Peptococcaceae bacterium]
MQALKTCCFQTPAKDLWLINSFESGFCYQLITQPIEVRHSSKVSYAIDQNSHLHLLINQNATMLHLIWDNSVWQKEILPHIQGERLFTYIDTENNLLVMFQISGTFSVLTCQSQGDCKVTELYTHNSDFLPLFFGVKGDKLFIYAVNNTGNVLLETIFNRENGQKVQESVIFSTKDYRIEKHWRLPDAVILVLKNTSSSAGLLILKICLSTKKQWSKEYKSLEFSSGLSFHLLLAQQDLLFLLSTPGDFYYAYSYDIGQNWSELHRSDVFSPVFFVDIYTVNNYPTSFICLPKIKGCLLQHPVILSYKEFSAMLYQHKLTLQGDRCRSPKIKKL